MGEGANRGERLGGFFRAASPPRVTVGLESNVGSADGKTVRSAGQPGRSGAPKVRDAEEDASTVILLGTIVFVVLPVTLAGWLVFAAYLEHRRDRVPILLYHRLIRHDDAIAGRVRDDEPIWVIHDTTFAVHMAHLRDEGFTALDFDDYLRIRRGEEPLPAKSVIVTFDDGYESNYTLAFPTLRANGQKATIYVAPEPDEHTRFAVQGIDGFLSAAQMREMVQHGIDIQSHSLTHCILNELSDDVVRFELTESRKRLEAITGKPVRHLAIPRAGYSRRVRRIAAELRYETVCCNNKGSATALSDVLALPRIVIDRDMSREDLARALQPRGSAMLRIVGDLKRIPERIGGARFAMSVRDLLYRGPLGPLFQT